jgi:hypothetical protein
VRIPFKRYCSPVKPQVTAIGVQLGFQSRWLTDAPNIAAVGRRHAGSALDGAPSPNGLPADRRCRPNGRSPAIARWRKFVRPPAGRVAAFGAGSVTGRAPGLWPGSRPTWFMYGGMRARRVRDDAGRVFEAGGASGISVLRVPRRCARSRTAGRRSPGSICLRQRAPAPLVPAR